jgi:hypothetical protein
LSSKTDFTTIFPRKKNLFLPGAEFPSALGEEVIFFSSRKFEKMTRVLAAKQIFELKIKAPCSSSL